MQRLLENAGFYVKPFPLWVFERTGRLESVFGTARTPQARLKGALSRMPLAGKPFGQRIILKWFGNSNFFFARKPS
jgi:hypothetical protein